MLVRAPHEEVGALDSVVIIAPLARWLELPRAAAILLQAFQSFGDPLLLLDWQDIRGLLLALEKNAVGGAGVETAVDCHVGLQAWGDLAQLLALLRLASVLKAKGPVIRPQLGMHI